MPEKETTISPELLAEAVKRVMTLLGSPEAPKTYGAGSTEALSVASTSRLDHRKDYPLSTRRPDLVRSVSGLPLEEITLEKVVAGQITFDDIRIRPETLEYQAQIAESSGRPRLAANLRRAAELTRIPDTRVLEIYNALRPYRSTKKDLLNIAEELEKTYGAKTCAALVREAAEVYEKRNRLRRG